MKNWILTLSVVLLMLGCKTSPKEESLSSMLMVMATENAYIVNGVEVNKTDHDAFLAALKQTGYSNLLLTGLEIGDLLQVSSQLDDAGFSLYYINSDSEIKAIYVD
ncbi:hypothetical protein QTP81_16960 [Alteromonas sp. ASW11-36]|uniref:Uncharacterized protein n=1 Tax=Alteromonas arenosi TaxID=3055817 RepID=A0ABT7T1G9_9ALTE|nr:hypothetical protein [Alteromonas sp. ASW11-36]MDM7862300.1 hypothetical protein [Alteromonas sp. ASW11-36]